ncbi:MAG: DUF4230 domain-containing protein [Lachnospiraceae bacterium]|nr:DUF4230 domain-containing protein [Lachnospiraceae bacterium]
MSEEYENIQKNGTGWIKWVVIGLVFFILVLGALAGIGYGVTTYLKAQQNQQPAVTSQYLASKLEDASDLTTAQITYTGIIHYDDGGIPFLTQKKYSMVYSATVEAGIDLSGVEIEVTDDKVIVKLPEVKVDEPQVDLDSIEFYDDSFALFNWDQKEDGVDAMKEAREDCKKKADISSLEGRAYENAKEIVRKLLEDAVGDRTIEVE